MRDDLPIVRRAVNERWRIPDELRDQLPEVVGKIATDKEGRPRDVINAARTLVAMDKVNLDAERADKPQEHVVTVRAATADEEAIRQRAATYEPIYRLEVPGDPAGDVGADGPP